MNRRAVMSLIAASLVVLASCNTGAGVLTISLDTTSLELLRGASETVNLTVSAAGTGPATLSVSGLPANVSASFYPPSLDGGATASTMTLTAAPAAAEGVSTLIVTATRGGSAATSELTVVVGSVTVNGTVLNLLGDGRSGVSVAIGTATATTGSDGTFTIAGVSVPYDVVVYEMAPDAYGHVFVGLTTATPEVLPYGSIQSTGYASATIDGTLPAAVPAASLARACVEGLDTQVLGCTELEPTEDTFAFFNATWVEGGAVDVRLHALLMTVGVDGLPTEFTSYGTADGSLTDGGTPVIPIAAYAAGPSAATLSGTVSAPPGYGLTTLASSTVMSPSFALSTVSASGTYGSSFSFAVPEFGLERYDLVAGASAADGSLTVGWRSGLEAGATGSMTLPAPATLVAPPDGTSSVTTSTAFTIVGSATAANTFVFSPDLAGPLLAVTTMSDTATLPNLGALGLPLPAASLYSWAVLESPSATTPEEAGTEWIAAYYSAVISTTLSGPPNDADGSITASASREFTTN